MRYGGVPGEVGHQGEGQFGSLPNAYTQSPTGPPLASSMTSSSTILGIFCQKKRYDGKLKSKLSKQDIWLCPQGLTGGDWDNDARKEQNGFLETIRERVSSIPFFLGLSSCIQQAITKCWLSTIVLDALMDSTKSLVLCSVGIAEKTSQRQCHLSKMMDDE